MRFLPAGLILKRQTQRLLIFLAIIPLICGFYSANAEGQTSQSAKARTLSLGIISETNRTMIAEHFNDFVRYVAGQLAASSEIQGKVVVAPTAFQLARLMDTRDVDFYMDSPYPTYLVNEVHGVGKLLLRRWKGGTAEYHGVIFTRKTGEISRLEDLKGKILVFEDPESTSGHFLPRALLTRKGFNFTDKSRFDPYAAPTDVGYLFAYSDQKLVDWVLTKKAAAGAFSDADWTRLDPQKRAELTILAETESLPRHFVSVRKDFPAAPADQLKKILLSMSENDQGRKILKSADNTTKFDVLPEGEAGLRRRMSEIFATAKAK